MLTARVTHGLMRQLADACREHQLLLAGNSAASLHGLTVAPPVRLDLVTAHQVTDPSTIEAIRNAVTDAVTRTIERPAEVDSSVGWVAVTSPRGGPMVDLTIHLVDEDLHGRGRLVADRAQLPPDGPTVLTLGRTDIARSAGLEWWRRPDDVRRTIDLGLAADRVGAIVTAAGWPSAPTGAHRTALLAGPAHVGRAAPMLGPGQADQARRGLLTIASEWDLRRGRSR